MLNRRSRREEPMKRKTALKWREELLFENFLDIHDEHEIWDIKCLISYFGATHLSKMSDFRHVTYHFSLKKYLKKIFTYLRGPTINEFLHKTSLFI